MSKIARFAATDHYWLVGPRKQVFSSRRAAFVDADDAEYLAFAERFEVPVIASKAELADVLAAAGVDGGAELPPADARDAALPPIVRRRLRDLETRIAALEKTA